MPRPPSYLRDVVWDKRVCLRGVFLSFLPEPQDRSVELAESASTVQAVDDCIAAAVEGAQVIT